MSRVDLLDHVERSGLDAPRYAQQHVQKPVELRQRLVVGGESVRRGDVPPGGVRRGALEGAQALVRELGDPVGCLFGWEVVVEDGDGGFRVNGNGAFL